MNGVLQPLALALTDPARPLPPGLLRCWNGSDPAARFAVHRNNVATALVGALADTFPVVQELVGPDFFRTMAWQYAAANLPATPVLAEYGDDFPAFVAGYAPADGLPYLADVARLERARVRAWHAADAVPLAAAEIERRLADPQRLAGSRLGLHPALAVVDSAYAVLALWSAHQGRREIESVDPFIPESVLVLRADDEVVVVGLPPAGATFLDALRAGEPLGRAAELAGAGCDLGATLGLLIRHQGICTWNSEA
jgi:hypothetical protein